MILIGHLKPNQRLLENELAGRLGLSRTPIREAFRELVQIGLLVSEPYKGVRVADLDLPAIQQIYEVRAVLETYAAELAAQRITDPEIQQLTQLNEQMRGRNQGVAQFAALNDQFHQVLNQATRNQVLLEIIANLRSRVRGFRVVFHYHPVLIESSVREHDEIIAALADRAPQRARDAMSRHIKSLTTELVAQGA